MIDKPKIPTIFDSTTLDIVGVHLIDTFMADESVKYDAERREVRLSTWRQDCAAGYRWDRLWFIPFKRWALRRWDLLFRNVEDCQIVYSGEKVSPPYYEIGRVECILPDKILLSFHYVLSITLVVSGIDGQLTETDEISFDLPECKEHDSGRETASD